jgi:flavodoxin
MEIGIIVYSKTGNTYSVAEKLQKKLKADGHSVELGEVKPVDEVKPRENITFENKPEIDEYDAVIFGSPVHAFSLAPAMKEYLNQIQSLEGKKVACYVTKGLPFHSTGGKQAISQMTEIIQSKDGNLLGTDILVWKGGKLENIIKLVDKLSALF